MKPHTEENEEFKSRPNRETPKREKPENDPYRIYPQPEEEPERHKPGNPEINYPVWLARGTHDFIWLDEITVYYSLN